jgi:four helix bundle protein
MKNKKKYEDIVDRLYRLALEIIKMVERLPRKQSVFSLGKQLIDSSTSACANALEARSARTPNEFISSFSISLKEAKETSLWLRFLRDLNLIEDKIYDKLLGQYQEVGKILSTIILNKKRNLKK